MARWAVRKRDGVWMVIDGAGKIRYASEKWRMAVDFALMRPIPKAAFLTTITAADLSNWNDVLRSLWEQNRKKDDDE